MRTLLFFSFCFFSTPMLAQQQPTTQEIEKTKKARALFEQAEIYYKIQQYDKALALYEEAYIISKQPGLLFNIGQCYKNMKQYESALRSYNTFLRDVPDTTIRPQVERLIKEMELNISEQPKPVSLPTSEPIASTSSPATIPASLVTNIATSAPSSQETTNQRLQRENLASAVPFYGGAALGGFVGLGAGAFFISARRQAAELLSQNNIAATDEIAFFVQRAAMSRTVAVAFLGTAALSASTGLVISSKNKKNEAQLFVSTNGVVLTTIFLNKVKNR